MQFADVALSKSEKTDVGVSKSLVDCGGIFLISTDTVQSFGNDIIELATPRVIKEPLASWADFGDCFR